MEYILRTNTVSKKYTNYYAVDKVSISIQKGEIYGLIGENGAGKSTLMKMIAGLVEPSEGSIELFGNFVPQTERYRMGCVIESPALYTELTAKQNLEVFRKAYGLSSKESVQQILKQVGLSQYENKIVKKFSLGMKQRLAIGVALLGNPDFLILDEPINGLDPTGIQDMRNFLLKLNREEHITIMISSHILGELSKIATKYGIIKNGKLIEEITAKEFAKFKSFNDTLNFRSVLCSCDNIYRSVLSLCVLISEDTIKNAIAFCLFGKLLQILLRNGKDFQLLA